MYVYVYDCMSTISTKKITWITYYSSSIELVLGQR